jgi:hypothetical protein
MLLLGFAAALRRSELGYPTAAPFAQRNTQLSALSRNFPHFGKHGGHPARRRELTRICWQLVWPQRAPGRKHLHPFDAMRKQRPVEPSY